MADQGSGPSSPAPSQRAARAEARERATVATRKKDWARTTVCDAVSGPSGSNSVNTAGSGKRNALVDSNEDRRSERSVVSSRSVIPKGGECNRAPGGRKWKLACIVIGEKAPRSRSVHSGVSSARLSRPNSVRSASAAPSVNVFSKINGFENVGERVRSRGLSEHGIPPRAQLPPVNVDLDESIVAGSLLNSPQLSSTQISSAPDGPNGMNRPATRAPPSARTLAQFLGLQGEVRTPDLVARVQEICRRPAEMAPEPFIFTRPMDPEPRHEPLRQYSFREFAPEVTHFGKINRDMKLPSHRGVGGKFIDDFLTALREYGVSCGFSEFDFTTSVVPTALRGVRKLSYNL